MAIKINGEILTEDAIRFELDRLVKFYSDYISPEEIMKQMDSLRQKAKEQAIGAKLLMNEADRLDIKVSPEDIDKRLEIMVKGVGGRENFEKILVGRNLTEETVRKSIEKGRKVDLLVEQSTSGVNEPTEAEILEHFEKHSNEYEKSERAQARHILIKFDPKNKADRETAMSRILEIKRKIQDGAEFSDQAAAHSDCPSGKKSAGSLGWVSRGMTVSEFDKALFSMKVGGLSDVIETQFGFHIIDKVAEERGGKADFDEVRERVREFLRHSYRGEALTAFVNELRAKARIEEN
ncbi:MAG: peptidylprolyl isomerase [Patescibacteria group bacterium]|jgi:parvulin-like peptidyl-prolyl isomerase